MVGAGVCFREGCQKAHHQEQSTNPFMFPPRFQNGGLVKQKKEELNERRFRRTNGGSSMFLTNPTRSLSPVVGAYIWRVPLIARFDGPSGNNPINRPEQADLILQVACRRQSDDVRKSGRFVPLTDNFRFADDPSTISPVTMPRNSRLPLRRALVRRGEATCDHTRRSGPPYPGFGEFTLQHATIPAPAQGRTVTAASLRLRSGRNSRPLKPVAEARSTCFRSPWLRDTRSRLPPAQIRSTHVRRALPRSSVVRETGQHSPLFLCPRG
jgi:hypothetical protein